MITYEKKRREKPDKTSRLPMITGFSRVPGQRNAKNKVKNKNGAEKKVEISHLLTKEKPAFSLDRKMVFVKPIAKRGTMNFIPTSIFIE